MVRTCAVKTCYSSEKRNLDLSFHIFHTNLELEGDNSIRKKWLNAIQRKEDDLKRIVVCSLHFKDCDYINPNSVNKPRRKYLKKGAVPSQLLGNEPEPTVEPSKSNQSTQYSLCMDQSDETTPTLVDHRLENEEETDSSPEYEGDPSVFKTYVSEATQTLCADSSEISSSCNYVHAFSYDQLIKLCDTETKDKKLFLHHTGFNSKSEFNQSLDFLLPDRNRHLLIYQHSKAAKKARVFDNSVFDNSDEESSESESDDVIHPNRSHKLMVEDEFLLMMMKLRNGLADLDLTVRFGISRLCQ